MKLSIHAMAIPTFAPMLNSLSDLLDKGAASARERSLDPETLVSARLAPDMYPLAMQVRLACEHATNAAAQLTAQPAPQFESDDSTLAALKARIATTIAYLHSAPAAAFQGAEDRLVTFAISDELEFAFDGFAFLRDWALPHFYFHVVTAYDILRHHGVAIGKQDYLTHVGSNIRPRQDRRL